jgi:hypothetical protein
MPLNLSQRFTTALTVANIFTNTALSFLGIASVLSIYAVMDPGVAGDTSTLSLTLNQGGATQQPIPPGYNIPAAQTVASGPRVPEDVVLAQYPIPANSQLVAPLAQTAATDVERIKSFVTP